MRGHFIDYYKCGVHVAAQCRCPSSTKTRVILTTECPLLLVIDDDGCGNVGIKSTSAAIFDPNGAATTEPCGDALKAGGPNAFHQALVPRPTIVVLCGSTRFKEEFIRQNARLTAEGKIVLSVGFFGHNPHLDGCAANRIVPGPCDKSCQTELTLELKTKLDALHLEKIALADEVFVVNVGGYYGESTRREIQFAKGLLKPITYLCDAPCEPIIYESRGVVTKPHHAVLGGAPELIGGQVAPIPNDQPSAHDLLIEHVKRRKEFGLQKYGTILQAGNGRKALLDVLEEVIDAAAYIIVRMEEDRLANEAKTDRRG